MSVGDWVQSIIGVVGVLATGVVAYLVLRLERGDRAREKARDAEEAAAADAKRTFEEAERERRAVRREQHKDDYSAANRALSTLDEIFRKAQDWPYTSAGFDEAGLEEAIKTVDQVRNRVPALYLSLGDVWLNAISISRVAYPVRNDFLRVFVDDRDEQAAHLETVVLAAVRGAVTQHQAGVDGQQAVRKARDAINKEWGA